MVRDGPSNLLNSATSAANMPNTTNTAILPHTSDPFVVPDRPFSNNNTDHLAHNTLINAERHNVAEPIANDTETFSAKRGVCKADPLLRA